LPESWRIGARGFGIIAIPFQRPCRHDAGAVLYLAAPARRQHRRRQSSVGQRRRQWPAQRQVGAGFAHRGAGLDAVAALRGDPEETGRVRCEATDQIAVGDEGAQAGPASTRSTDSHGGRFLDPVDAQRDVVVLRLHVVRLDRIGIRAGTEQQAGIGFEVVALVEAGDERPVCRGKVSGGSNTNAERRLGVMPIGATPASVATWSTQAPAALSNSGARNACTPSSTCQPPVPWLIARMSTFRRSWPPRARSPRRKP
jgi:hypothetical protein